MVIVKSLQPMNHFHICYIMLFKFLSKIWITQIYFFIIFSSDEKLNNALLIFILLCLLILSN